MNKTYICLDCGTTLSLKIEVGAILDNEVLCKKCSETSCISASQLKAALEKHIQEHGDTLVQFMGHSGDSVSGTRILQPPQKGKQKSEWEKSKFFLIWTGI